MFRSRRNFIAKMLSIGTYGLTFASGLLHSSFVHAQWLRFNLTHYHETVGYLFQGAELIDNHYKIQLYRLPNVAENGANVPIKIVSTFKNITKIYILVQNNPRPLSAEFNLSPAVVAQVSARLKMDKTSNVVVIVEADGKLYRKIKKVKVVKGGCGG